MSVKAVILAGGQGERLRPLTSDIPKPMMPLLEKPVMAYTLELLKKHGILDISVTLCYHAGQITSFFGDGKAFGVHFHYLEEHSPRGTAGSLSPLRNLFKDTFIVLSGDALTDLDLTKALAFHKDHHAAATIVLKKSENPLPYGVVMTNENHKITGFTEKPTWKNVFSDLVNTGIYIFEPRIFDYIPNNGISDFAKNVFPRLLSDHENLFGFETEDYWCDIGSQSAYLEAQMDLLQGKVHLSHPFGIHPDAAVHPNACLSGSCYIGPHAVVEEGACLHNALLFEGAHVHARAAVNTSCLWQNSAAGEDTFLNHTVLCENAEAGNESILSPCSALGHDAALGPGAFLYPNVKVMPFLAASPNTLVKSTVSEYAFPSVVFRRENIFLVQSESGCQFMYALYRQFHPRAILFAAAEGSGALSHFLSGLAGGMGIFPIECTCVSLPMAKTLLSLSEAELCLCIDHQQVTILDRHGLLEDGVLSSLQGLLGRCHVPSVFVKQHSPRLFPKAEQCYLNTLLPLHPIPSSIPVHFKIFCSHPPLLKLCAKALLGSGARYVSMNPMDDMTLRDNEAGFVLHENGMDCLPFTARTTPSPDQKKMLSLLCCLKNGSEKLYDFLLPAGADQLAPVIPEDDSSACRFQKRVMTDGIAFCAAMAPLLSECTLEELLTEVPESHSVSVMISCQNQDKGKILSSLSRTSLPHILKDGLHIHDRKGDISIVPDAFLPRIRLTSASQNQEFAEEMCNLYRDKIYDLLSRP